MEQPFSTSKVTVEYYDPHGLYKLLSPGLAARLPLRHLHWQSHSGPLRSIDSLHVELVSASSNAPPATASTPNQKQGDAESSATAPDDGFQTAAVGGRRGSLDAATKKQPPRQQPIGRRHQIPGLRRTPYLKLLLVRCDDNDTYKAHTRAEIKDWVKQNTAQGSSKKSASAAVAENHDAYEWMIVHVVLPNSAAYAQPRTNKSGSEGSSTDLSSKSTSRWGKSSSTILERLRADFNTGASSSSSGTSKGAVDRVAQIRVGLEDVPYEMLPRVIAPAPSTITNPAGYVESPKDAENAWVDLVDKFKSLILASFDVRVSQYEEDIREKDMQRSLPGWNFCTFFILKEGLAHGFESVGLVEDALVGYDELSVGLDTIIKEQQADTRSPEEHGGALLKYTADLKHVALHNIRADGDDDDEPIDLQANDGGHDRTGDIPISSTKKPYRDLILANNVSVFDFRCYIFARQVSLLLRLGNAWSTREELLSKLKEQQDASMPGASAPAPSSVQSSSKAGAADESENLSMLAEICRRTLEFVPAVSQVMREDLLFAIQSGDDASSAEAAAPLNPDAFHVVDNMVASFAFSTAQQILAQTSTHALPIPSSAILSPEAQEPKTSIPDPKTMMHPARTSSLEARGQASARGGPPPSPNVFSGSGQPSSRDDAETSQLLRVGLEELAVRRADLYMLSRNILQKGGEKKGWSDGWSSAPIIHGDADDDSDDGELEDISLDDGPDDESKDRTKTSAEATADQGERTSADLSPVTAGIENVLLCTALASDTGFFRLYEILTHRGLSHYTVAGHTRSVSSNLADLAVLKYQLKDYAAAASYFAETMRFFSDNSWDVLELSMLLMYSHCVKALGRKSEYAWLLLKFLTKVAESERQRLQLLSSSSGPKRLGQTRAAHKALGGVAAVKGCLDALLAASVDILSEMRVPLTNFFCVIEIEGPPTFADQQDSFFITLRLDSLLVEPMAVDSIKARMVQHSKRGPPREVWLESRGTTSLPTGRGAVKLYSNTIIPGLYEIDQVRIVSKNLVLYHDRDPVARGAKAPACILEEPHVILYQRTDGLGVELSTSKDLQLDKNNDLELTLLTGWNKILSCEMRIRAATGGLRLLTTEARIIGSEHSFSKPVENGTVHFGSIDSGTSLVISFPFSIEQDVLELCLRIEVTYSTQDGTFTFATALSASTALALGVNVQDVFKHDALFSRFTVSTATASPLQVLRSELIDSELFTSQFGTVSGGDALLPMVFPKQPASLLYKIMRKPETMRTHTPVAAASADKKASKRTMYIRLHYTVFQDELEKTVRASLRAAFDKVPALYQFSKLAVARVMRHVHSTLSAYDLERAALLNEMATAPVLAHVDWAREFPGLRQQHGGDGSSTADELASVIRQWQQQHPILSIPPPQRTTAALARTILIPVEIPSITIVHTADIQLQQPLASAVSADVFKDSSDGDDGSDEFEQHVPGVSMPVFCVNQLLPATLHLKWTRIWNTDTGDGRTRGDGADGGGAQQQPPRSQKRVPQFDDLEFSFEVLAPTDAWLIGGRRKGHFVIPAPDGDGDAAYADTGVGLSSTSRSEAAIPLLLIPLREGRLPYPSVEIREVMMDVSGGGDGQGYHQSMDLAADEHALGHHCETDYRNLGETVHIVADRTRVTLSLDASGPGGGPLMLESERGREVGRIVA